MKPVNFTLGADPELLCIRPADAPPSHDADNDDEFGLDGSQCCFEVRPAPSVSPIQLVHNIHQVFLGQVARKPTMLGYNWRAGSYYGHPLGGHIHFGIRDFELDADRAEEYSKVLDDYVGAVTALIEDREEAMDRRVDYGANCDYRVNDWGFEYRTPSSWVTSPYVAAGVLSLAKTVMNQLLNHKVKHGRAFRYRGYTSNWSFKAMDTDTLRLKWPDIWRDIKNMDLYPKYKVYLDFLFYLIDKKLNWFPKSGMKNSWGIVDLEYPMTFELDVIWKRYQLQGDETTTKESK